MRLDLHAVARTDAEIAIDRDREVTDLLPRFIRHDVFLRDEGARLGGA
jgi:hypothetical protein